MSHLFEIENSRVFPNSETLLIEPFKTIWERDKDPKKHNAISELSYIEFMISELQSNPFRDYEDEEKELRIIQEVIRNDKWKPDAVVKHGIEKLKDIQTKGSLNYRFWLSNKQAVENTIKFLGEEDKLGKTNLKTGNPLYKPKDIIGATEKATETLSFLSKLEKKVLEDFFSESRTIGNKRISTLAKPKKERR